jgi:hypothetical protein
VTRREPSRPSIVLWQILAVHGLVSWLLISCCGCRATHPNYETTSDGRPVRVFIAAGQSNMTGFGAFAASKHRLSHPLITYQYRTGTSGGVGSPQTVPVFFRHGSIRQGFACFHDRGVGPWWAFAQEMKRRGDDEVRILMLAVNGSSLSDWCQQGGLLDQAIGIVTEAAPQNATVEGVIWHHGESGVGDGGGDYHDMLSALVAKLRLALQKPDLPFVAATLPAASPHSGEVNAALERLAATTHGFAVVDGHSATMTDAVHLDTAASEALGVAMATAMVRLHSERTPTGE